jgi:hypothetical protein
MPREVFDKNHSYAKNPRNLVAGKFNDKTPNPEVLKDCEYVRYGMETDEFDFETKSEVLDYLNETQKTIVPYENIEIKDLTEEYLKELFIKWSSQYEIDGVILEVNDLKLQKELGRERNNNPVFARAFKGDFEEVKESKVVSITIQVSKRGYLKPVVNIEPIELDGVTVTNPTGYNFRFIKEMGIGIGSIVKVKRSGMVIPKIIKTVKRVEFEMPVIKEPASAPEAILEVYRINGENKEELVDSQPLALAGPISDLAYQMNLERASSAFSDRGARIAMKHVMAIIAAYQTYQSVKNNSDELFARPAALATYLLAAKTIKESERADTRQWSTLPSQIFLAEFKLGPGDYKLKAVSKELKKPIELGKLKVKSSKKDIFSYRLP